MANCKKTSFVAITGNNGSGKSTLCALLGAELGWHVLPTLPMNHPYLDSFLMDPMNWSFHNQLQFIVRKFAEQSTAETLDVNGVFCQDRSAYDCYQVFTRKLHDDGFLSPRDFACITEAYVLLSGLIASPDLIIHLRAPAELLYHRIVTRARPADKSISLPYLADLEQRYDQWIGSMTSCPTVIIDTRQQDYRHDKEERQHIIGKISSVLAQ